jgi:2-dehydropantoate 2-reductase
VWVVCKSNFAQVKEQGFQLHTTIWGNGVFTPHHVFEAGSALQCMSQSGYAYIILANKIKTEQSRLQMLHDLQQVTTANTILVSIQNGLGNEAALRDAFPNNSIISMVCNLVCCQVSPGVTEQRTSIKPHAFHAGVYGRISKTDFTTVELKAIEGLIACDEQFIVVDNALLEKWQKIVFNNAWNSMTALTGVNTHELFESPAAIELVRHLADEACQIGIASGVEMGGMVPEKVLEIAKSCEPIVTSTLFDARRGRALELAPITGRHCIAFFIISRPPY